MKFNKIKKELHEMDDSDYSGMRYNDRKLGANNSNTYERKILDNVTNSKEASKTWISVAKPKGIDFQAYLLGVVQNLKGNKRGKDYSSTTYLKKNTENFNDGNKAESAMDIVLRNLDRGGKLRAKSRWHIAQKKGVTFSSFLIGLIDEINKGSATDSDRPVMDGIREDRFDDEEQMMRKIERICKDIYPKNKQ